MKNIPYLFCILILTFSCKTGEVEHQDKEIVNGPLGEKFDNYFSRLEPFGLSGSFLIAQNDTIIFHKAYGLANRETLSKNSVNTLFSTGSLTKQFTAAAILKLEEKGKLKTSDPLALHLKEVPEDKKAITLHHLLTHTSGLPAIVSKDDFDSITRDEFVNRLMEKPLAFEPGSDFLYSNSAYGLLAIIIEDLSGKSYEDFLTSEFFDAANISTIGYDLPVWDTMEEARNYIDNRDYGPFQDRNFPNWNLIGNGGLLTTSKDLYKWMIALKNNNLITEQSLEKMLTPFLNEYGYGWEVFEDNGQMIEHTGSGDGNNSIIQWYVEKDILFIGLSNYSFDGKDLVNYIYEDVYQLIHGREIQMAPKIDPKSLDSIDLALEGQYHFDSSSQIIIQPFYKGLKIKTTGQEAINLLALGYDYVPHLYDQKNATALEVFRLTIEQNDFSGFRKLIDDEKSLPAIQHFLTSFMEDLEFEKPKVHPYFSERNEDGLQSYIAISNGDEEISSNRRYPFLSLVWRDDGSYRGIGSITQVPRAPSYYFVKNQTNDFVGFNWGNKNVIKVFIEHTNENSDTITINFGPQRQFYLKRD